MQSSYRTSRYYPDMERMLMSGLKGHREKETDNVIVPFDTQRELFMGTERLRAEAGSKQEHPGGQEHKLYLWPFQGPEIQSRQA